VQEAGSRGRIEATRSRTKRETGCVASNWFIFVFLDIAMKSAGTLENRRNARIAVLKGMWVSWQAGGPRNVSRVRDLSAGGVFVATPTPAPVGTAVKLLFALPEGEMRIDGVVRYTDAKRGMGVEFTGMGTGDRARWQELLRRLNP